MKPFLIATAAAATAFVAAQAQAHESCDALKTRIESQIKGHKVGAYTLEVVDKSKAGDAKVVGTCGGGAKEIAYKKKP